MNDEKTVKCEICGEPMPSGEEMFKYHGYSGPCPKSPIPKIPNEPLREVWVVSNKEGCDFVAEYRQGAMEHAAIMAGEFPELSPWSVCKYVAEPFEKKHDPLP